MAVYKIYVDHKNFTSTRILKFHILHDKAVGLQKNKIQVAW